MNEREDYKFVCLKLVHILEQRHWIETDYKNAVENLEDEYKEVREYLLERFEVGIPEEMSKKGA